MIGFLEVWHGQRWQWPEPVLLKLNKNILNYLYPLFYYLVKNKLNAQKVSAVTNPNSTIRGLNLSSKNGRTTVANAIWAILEHISARRLSRALVLAI